VHEKPIAKLRSVTCHIGSHVIVPALTPAKQAGTQFTYIEEMKGSVTLTLALAIYRNGLPVCRHSFTHPSSERPDRQSNSQPFDRESDVLTATLPRKHHLPTHIVNDKAEIHEFLTLKVAFCNLDPDL